MPTASGVDEACSTGQVLVGPLAKTVELNAGSVEVNWMAWLPEFCTVRFS